MSALTASKQVYFLRTSGPNTYSKYNLDSQLSGDTLNDGIKPSGPLYCWNRAQVHITTCRITLNIFVQHFIVNVQYIFSLTFCCLNSTRESHQLKAIMTE